MNLRDRFRKLFVGRIRKVREWKRAGEKSRGRESRGPGLAWAVGWGLGVGWRTIQHLQDSGPVDFGGRGIRGLGTSVLAGMPGGPRLPFGGMREGADHSSLRFLGMRGRAEVLVDSLHPSPGPLRRRHSQASPWAASPIVPILSRSAWWSWTVRLDRSGPRLCRSLNA